MTARLPLYIKDDGNLQTLTQAQLTSLLNNEIKSFWSFDADGTVDPLTKLTYVSSSGNLGNISDTRYRSGTAHQSTGDEDTDADADDYVQESSTGEPDLVTVQWGKIQQTIKALGSAPLGSQNSTNPATSIGTFPLYWDGSNVKEMSLTDCIDTFIKPLIASVSTVDGDASNNPPSMYYIHTATSLSGYNAVSSNPVFQDLRADVSEYTAANIGTSGTYQDHNETISSFYLLRKQEVLPTSVLAADEDKLCYYTSAGHLQRYSWATKTFQHTFRNIWAYANENVANCRIAYNLSNGSGSGTNVGSGMTDTILSTNNTGAYTTIQDGQDYRSQEFPNGTQATANTWRLKINVT
tara:strand:+ start:448 stop:1503 length:1056 start_codon:yes stop_codon:yes gene_type:complete